ncbi:hypothetical protein TcWFU_004627 [Taenia crassiceps]|uniref:Prolactin receptor n=1 Tax=Taenia crassiceps TaxID=6207 RepID=A0ABR4QAT2_9CEST
MAQHSKAKIGAPPLEEATLLASSMRLHQQDNLGLKVGQGNNMRRRMPSNLADSSPTTNIMLEADGRSVERTEECDNEEWSCAPLGKRIGHDKQSARSEGQLP